MTQKPTVERLVLEILKDCPQARHDDMLLYLYYYNRYGLICTRTLTFEQVLRSYKRLGLPCFETIRRARQRVQSCVPEVSRNPKPTQGDRVSIVINLM